MMKKVDIFKDIWSDSELVNKAYNSENSRFKKINKICK